MRVLVCGGRNYDMTDEATHMWFTDHMEKIAFDRFPRLPEDEYGNFLYDVTIIAGGARGIDTMAIDWAVVNWCPFKEFPADWNKYGKRAGYLRNKQMLEEGHPDLVVAFPGGKGTTMMVQIAEAAGVPVLKVE